jgi:RNA polymerase sigma factor (sigma-70 family)
MVTDDNFAECIRICIRKRRLHLKIKQLGYDIEEFVHEVIVRTFMTDAAREKNDKPPIKDFYAYGTIADRQLTWTLSSIAEKQKKKNRIRACKIVESVKSPDPNCSEAVDSKDYVDFVLNLNVLNNQEKKVMKLRYIKNLTFREAAKFMPVSHERVRLIEKTAVKKLKNFYECESKLS